MSLLPLLPVLIVVVIFSWLFWITQTTLSLAQQRNSHPSGWRGARFALFPGPWWRPHSRWHFAYARPRPWYWY